MAFVARINSEKEVIILAKRRKNRKANIKKWTSRHTNIVNALARFNVVTVENLRKVSMVANKQMSENAFLDMKDLKYFSIETVEYKGEFIKVAIIGDASIRKVRDIATDTTKSIYNSSSILHDLEHSNFIFDTFEIGDIQKYYRSEKELISLELEKKDVAYETDISPTDGAFIYEDERENLFIETATQHYTKAQREAHRNFANSYGGRFIENKVRTPRKPK